MKSAITVATIAIAAMVNRSGWVAACNGDGFDSVMSLAGLTALRSIVVASYGRDAQKAEDVVRSIVFYERTPHTGG